MPNDCRRRHDLTVNTSTTADDGDNLTTVDEKDVTWQAILPRSLRAGSEPTVTINNGDGTIMGLKVNATTTTDGDVNRSRIPLHQDRAEPIHDLTHWVSIFTMPYV